MRCETPHAIAAALPKGAALILRDYDYPDREAFAKELVGICSGHGVLTLIGGSAALAERVGADGVHLRARDIVTRPAAPQGMIVSAACHSAAELILAARAGAHIAFLSPVFETASHPGAPTLGVTQFKALAANAPLPVLALGGVDETNAAALKGPNVCGFGAIGAFLPS